ncbi:MAG TPA: hypothetical protein VMU89_14130 [Thermomicrobiaceae bacterium]|nr:hypothetical protein [Thermomicrobiaceae bacterium]
MVNGALLVVAVVVVLVVVGLLVLGLGAGRRRRVLPTATVTQELPIVQVPRRDWAASVQPLRSREIVGDGAAVTVAPLALPARPFRPPIYRGRSRGVVLRQTPLAARWPAAMRRRPRGGWLPERRSPRNV